MVPTETADVRPELYFKRQLDNPGAFGDPGSVPPQDIDEPLARDVAFRAAQTIAPGQTGPKTAAAADALDKESAMNFNIGQPLGPIGLSQDRMMKLQVTSEDVNRMFKQKRTR